MPAKPKPSKPEVPSLPPKPTNPAHADQVKGGGRNNPDGKTMGNDDWHQQG